MRSVATWLVLAVFSASLAVLFYRSNGTFRRRVRIALRVGAVGYLLLFATRAVQQPPGMDQLETLGLVGAAMALVWIGLWLAATAYGHRPR